MRLTIRLLGTELLQLTVTIGPTRPPRQPATSTSIETERPALEATGGGQFELAQPFGFAVVEPFDDEVDERRAAGH